MSSQVLAADAGLRLDTPAFVVDVDAIAARTAALVRAVDGCSFAYSVKTLPVPEAVRAARDAGWLVEVVSEHEYAFVRGLGAEPSEIVVNGPAMSCALLRAALGGGAIVHVDSEEELHRAMKMTPEGTPGRLGVRLGAGVAEAGWARFGVDVSCQATSVRRLADLGKGRIRGFHVHSGTSHGSVDEFRAVAARALQFAEAYADYTDTPVEWVDLGGGLADAGILSDGCAECGDPLERIALDAAMRVSRWTGVAPALIFEPGRSLVGACVDLFTRVESVKHVAGVQAVTVDAGVNTLPFARHVDYHVDVCGETSDGLHPSTVYGPLCMFDDVLCRNAMLPPLKRGALLRLRGVGAYNISMAFDFTRPRAKTFVQHRGAMMESRPMFG